MTNFVVNMFNHSAIGQRSLEDVVGIMGFQMRECGHQVVWAPENDKLYRSEDGYNLIVEGFTPEVVQVIAEQHAAGAKFICLATEEPSDKGFNQGTQKEMVMRQENFVQVAPYLDGIIHLVPGDHVTNWYSQFAPTVYAELGYAPKLVRIDSTEPTFDFGFFGSLSKRRLSILKRLAKRCGKENAIRIVADFPSQIERDKIMRQCKVIVQLRKFDDMGLVSSSRCNTSLCIGRPVVAEPHLLCKPWDEVVHFSKDEDQFFRDAIMMLPMWRQIHAGQLTKFKEKFPPDFCIGEPLRRLFDMIQRKEALNVAA